MNLATNPVQQAQQTIEAAVLQYLQPTKGGTGYGPKQISVGVGLFRKKNAYGAINALVEQGLIEPAPQANGLGGWRIR
jgi:hypothetical protein